MENTGFETMNNATIEYALKESDLTRKKFENTYMDIRNRLEPFVYAKRMKAVSIGKNMLCYVTIDDGKNNLVLNDKIIYSTENLIIWIKIEKDGNKIALFETSGSDEGILKLIENNKVIYEENGFINDILFYGEKFYIIKEERHESVNNSKHNCNGVYMDGKKVFGSQLKPGFGISGNVYGNKVILTAGDNAYTQIYSGSIDDPDSWALIEEYNSPVKVLDYADGILELLIFKDNGIIKGSSKIDFHEPVDDAVSIKDGYLAVQMRDAKSVLILYDKNGNKLKEFLPDIPEGLISMDSYENHAVILTGSFGMPYKIYSYRNKAIEKIEENKLSSPLIEERYVTSGSLNIHYFLLKAKNSKNTLVYGYGGFNISVMPVYNPLFAYLVNNGVNVVVCNLPGGGEYGESWHRLGMKENKINVFNAFRDVIYDLKKSGNKIICYGVSNGGLLSSYTLTDIPESLEAAIIGNPVIDLMRFHKLLAGQYWTSEYGNPEDQKDAEYLKKYSPINKLRDIKYPPAFIYTRLNDDRVHPSHALKFHEMLKERKSESYILTGKGGHLGSGPDDILTETAYIAAFINYIFSKNY